jgi:TP901 family phage tail tape measure protein
MANLELSQVGESFKNVGGSAADAGLSIDEVGAFLKVMADNLIKGGAAGTALAGVIKNLSTPTNKAIEEFENLGIALYDSEGAQRNIMDVMQELEGVLSTMTDEQRKHSESVIFDTVSMKAWNTITSEGVGTIRDCY